MAKRAAIVVSEALEEFLDDFNIFVIYDGLMSKCPPFNIRL